MVALFSAYDHNGKVYKIISLTSHMDGQRDGDDV